MPNLPDDGCLVNHPARLVEGLVEAARMARRGELDRGLRALLPCHGRVHELVAVASMLAGTTTGWGRPDPARAAERIAQGFILAGADLDPDAIRELTAAHCGICQGHGDLNGLVEILGEILTDYAEAKSL